MFVFYRDLESWLTGIKALVSSDELAKDVAGAEALLERHQVFFNQLGLVDSLFLSNCLLCLSVRNIEPRLMREMRRFKHSMISVKNWLRKNIMPDLKLRRNFKLLMTKERIWRRKDRNNIFLLDSVYISSIKTRRRVC